MYRIEFIGMTNQIGLQYPLLAGQPENAEIYSGTSSDHGAVRVKKFRYSGTTVTVTENNPSEMLGTVSASDAMGAKSPLKRLRYLRNYQAGWDGPGSLVANERSFELAEYFLALLPTLRTSFEVDALIYYPGNAVLSLMDEDASARLEFLPDGTIAANIDVGDQEIDLDLTGFDGGAIPADLSKLLKPQLALLAA